MTRAKPAAAKKHPEMMLQDNGEWVLVKIRTSADRDVELMELCAKMLVLRWTQELDRE